MGRREVLEAKRDELGLSQEEFARVLGIDRGTYRRWLSGEIGRLRPGHRRRLSEVFGVSVPEVDRLLGSSRHGSESDDVRHTSESDVEQLRADVAHLVDLDGRYGGDDVLPLAVRLFRSSYRRLVTTRARTSSAQRDLRAAVAEAGEVAGWVAFDAERLDLARALSLEALHLARLAGDRSMELFVFANLGMIDLHQHQTGEALSIGEHVMDGHPAGRVGALFTVREARGLAQRGEARRALEAVGRARILLDEGIASGDPSWSWWFDSAELAWHRATVHVELGDRATAVDGYREAFETRAAIRAAAGNAEDGAVDRRHRGDFNDLAHLVQSVVEVEAWPEVEALMPEVLDYTREISSARTRRVLRRVAQRVNRSRTATSTVQDQVEELAATLGAGEDADFTGAAGAAHHPRRAGDGGNPDHVRG